MDAITVESSGDEYRVTVTGGGSSTSHAVTIDTEIPSEASPAELVEASFRFLLDREPKEAILSRFGLSAIAGYFPDYPEKVGDYL